MLLRLLRLQSGNFQVHIFSSLKGKREEMSHMKTREDLISFKWESSSLVPMDQSAKWTKLLVLGMKIKNNMKKCPNFEREVGK